MTRSSLSESTVSSVSWPGSEPTSDELPDLGFNQLLREYSHLQRLPRIPIQIRSPTSSTTPTCHPSLSEPSTFTRPPTSSLQPDGSTVWNHPLMATYLPTDSEDDDDDDDDDSSALTVEIQDSLDDDGQSPNLTSSPEPIPILIASDIDSLSGHNHLQPLITPASVSVAITGPTLTSSESASTLINVFLNGSRNPNRTSSSFSLISYQLPDTPDIDSHLPNCTIISSTLALPNPHSFLAATPLTNPHSFAATSPLTNPHSFTTASPLINPHSLPATTPLMNPYSSPATNLPLPIVDDPQHLVNDLDTPASESILFDPSGPVFEPIHDDQDEPSASLSASQSSRQSTIDTYRPGLRTPRYLSARTPNQPAVSPIGEHEHMLPENEGAETIQRPDHQSTKQTTLEHIPPLITSHLLSQPIPYPSMGLHLLPSSPLSALIIPPCETHLAENNQPEPVSHEDPDAEQFLTEAATPHFPSLGYLDEALSFIAAERARLSAARASATTSLSSEKEQVEAGGEDDGLIGVQDGDYWRDNIGGESKQKRRRKKPLKQPLPSTLTPSPPKERRNAGSTTTTSTSSNNKKRRSKSAAPPLSSSGSMLSLKSGTMTPGRRKDKGKEKERYHQHKGKNKEFLIAPSRLPSSSNHNHNHRAVVDSDFDDGGRTPTNVPGLVRVSSLSLGMSLTTLSGMGKTLRIGRREREKMIVSKARNSVTIKSTGGGGGTDSFDDPIEIGVEYGSTNTDNDDDGEDEGVEESGEGLGENDSISNMSLLQPPRRLRTQNKREHSLFTKVDADDDDLSSTKTAGRDSVGGIEVSIADSDGFVVASNFEGDDKRRRSRPKTTKPIIMAPSRAYPLPDADVAHDDIQQDSPTTSKRRVILQDDDDDGIPTPSLDDNTKPTRLLALTKSLQQFFPEQREELGRVMRRIEKTRRRVGNDGMVGSNEGVSNMKGKGRVRAASEGALAATGSESLEGVYAYVPMTDVEEEEEEEEEREEAEEDVDPRGRLPKKKDPLIHVFIDHSNILIGLLSYLRRTTAYRKRIYRKPLSALIVTTPVLETPINPNGRNRNSSSSSNSLRRRRRRPLPTLPTTTDRSSREYDHPIPLPSFATFPRSLASASFLSSLRNTKTTDDVGGSGVDHHHHHHHSSEEVEYHRRASRSDGSGMECVVGPSGSGTGTGSGGSGLMIIKEKEKEKKGSKQHLWHAALILILERGRPVTRRVVVASSPLYQPMDSIERFGYDLRVFIRVPDFGDGMDREHNADKGKTSSSNTRTSQSQHHHHHHQSKRISGSESGSGGTSSRPYHSHPKSTTPPTTAAAAAAAASTAANPGTSPGKIKYREQGVDELLQLKLHQAIAASSDRVPDGSTIVLATGDGNIGQFNEDGFLGPIRTALKRGWKVELYAWEGGLSRAWKREFGEDTEWGKRGRFRIVGMEQFASWLVE